jgi:putative component of membrane protein insertase Oxa1/YidC/SpoIIIJ protein YidD
MSKRSIIALALCAAWCSATPAAASNTLMKAPRAAVRLERPAADASTSSVDLVFLGAIGVYRRYLSAGRWGSCGFQPSCSTFGRDAVRERGPWLGVLMTGDRLLRCNVFKKPGPDYTLLPNGKLWDPPESEPHHE